MKKSLLLFLLFYSQAIQANTCLDFLSKPIDLRGLDQVFIYTQNGKNHFQVERKGIQPLAIIMKRADHESNHSLGFDDDAIARLAVHEFSHRHTTALFDIRQITFRMKNPQDFNNFLTLNKSSILRDYIWPLDRAMSQLYSSYESQGVERANLMPTIKSQDKSETERVTRFLIQRGIQPVAHIQILESENGRQKLHIEDEFPEDAKLLSRRNPTEKIGELGRLYVTNPNQKHSIFDSLMTTVDGFNNSDSAHYQFSVLHEAISYAIHYGNFDRLILQINLKVEKVLQRKKVPFDKAERVEVSKMWLTESGEQKVTEAIYSFNREAMQAMDDFFLKEIYKRQFQEVLGNDFFASQGGAFFEFQQREVLALIRLGILDPEFVPLGLTVNSATSFKDPITQEEKGLIFMTLEKIKDYLDNSAPDTNP